MPSPFPGPDPYLEQPALWPAVHQRLITYLADELNGLLPPRYVANIGERVCVGEAGPREVFVEVLALAEHGRVITRIEVRRHGPHDGLVCLHRGGGGRFEVWPLSLRERLPRVRVPLAGDDPDVIVDLQPLYDRCYDSGGFARRIDYRAEPPVPLRPDDAEWSAELLRSRGPRGRA